MTARQAPDHDAMVTAILATYRRASAQQVEDGRRWYPAAGRIVDGIARELDADPERTCFVLAALSPRNPWLWNVADAYAYMAAARSGGAMPSATTFGANRATAWRIATGGDAWHGAAPKVRAFVCAILGDRDAVVVDTWAARVATGGTVKHPERWYHDIAGAYQHAAHILGEDARDVQAITWIVAQSEGLASARRGRHDLTYKAGTPVSVRTIIATATLDGPGS